MEFDIEKFKRLTSGGSGSAFCTLQFRSDHDKNIFFQYLEEHCICYTGYAAQSKQVYWNEETCCVWGHSFVSEFVTLDDLLLEHKFDSQSVLNFIESEDKT